jgi:hypothetical protein
MQTADRGVEMSQDAREMADVKGDPLVTVGMRVRVHPGVDAESGGIVTDDFGATAGYPVAIGDIHIAEPARRWAVLLDTGCLVFVDSDDILPE